MAGVGENHEQNLCYLVNLLNLDLWICPSRRRDKTKFPQEKQKLMTCNLIWYVVVLAEVLNINVNVFQGPNSINGKIPEWRNRY